MSPTITDWITTGISFACMIGSIIGFNFARKEEKRAKASEEQAKLYAKNADEANVAAQKYYKKITELIEEQQNKEEQSNLENKIIMFISKNKTATTKEIANELDLTNEEIHPVIEKLYLLDEKIKPAYLACIPTNPDCQWKIV